jgi:hypothetical protein
VGVSTNLPDEKSQVQNLAEIHEERRKPQNTGDCGRLFSSVVVLAVQILAIGHARCELAFV